jgi:type IV secretion system protein VirD4
MTSASGAGLADVEAGTADDGGPRRQPELSEDTEYSPEELPQTNDLALLDDDDVPLPLPRQLDPSLQRTARLASLDPDDGIQL